MRGTEYLFLVVIIGVFAWITFQGSSELNQAFTENPIELSDYEDSTSDIQKIQDKTNKTLDKFLILGEDDKAWYQKIGAGIVAIPYAVVTFPQMIALAVNSLTKLMTKNLAPIVPQVIMLAIMTFLLIYVVRELLAFFQRSRA